MAKKQDVIYVTDQDMTNQKEEGYYCIKNWVAQEWLPIIGMTGIGLYNIYLSAADADRGNSWFFSIRTLSEYTFISKNTIVLHNWLLEICGLISIESGTNGYTNEYTILDPPRVTPDLLKKIVAILEVPADVGQTRQRFKQRVIDRINLWKPISACVRIPQYQR